MAFAEYSRDALRQCYAEAWRRRRERLPLSPLDALIVDVLAQHPEYHALVDDVQTALRFEADRGGDEENPFLHMGLHLAVREQLSIDRPPGIKALHHAIAARSTDPHEAEHALMHALALTLAEARHTGLAPDEQQYLERVRRLL